MTPRPQPDPIIHPHTHAHSKEVVRRLARIEGHVRAVKQMVEDGRPCPEVIHQIGAVESALRRVAQAVIEDHLDQCIAGAAQDVHMRDLVRDFRSALSQYLR